MPAPLRPASTPSCAAETAALARLETKREDVLEVIELRLGTVPESAREAVTGCTSFEALKAAHRALVLGEGVEAVVATLR